MPAKRSRATLPTLKTENRRITAVHCSSHHSTSLFAVHTALLTILHKPGISALPSLLFCYPINDHCLPAVHHHTGISALPSLLFCYPIYDHCLPAIHHQPGISALPSLLFCYPIYDHCLPAVHHHTGISALPSWIQTVPCVIPADWRLFKSDSFYTLQSWILAWPLHYLVRLNFRRMQLSLFCPWLTSMLRLSAFSYLISSWFLHKTPGNNFKALIFTLLNLTFVKSRSIWKISPYDCVTCI